MQRREGSLVLLVGAQPLVDHRLDRRGVAVQQDLDAGPGDALGHREVPARESKSEWLTPQACTWISTSAKPTPGSRMSAYCIASAGPYS